MESGRVEIYGRYYTIKGVSDQAYLEKLAGYVDSQMRQIVSTTGTVDTLKVAILAALTIADAQFRAEERQHFDADEFVKSIDALSDQIQLVLSPDEERTS